MINIIFKKYIEWKYIVKSIKYKYVINITYVIEINKEL